VSLSLSLGSGGALSRVAYDLADSVDDDAGLQTVDSASSSGGAWDVTISGLTATTDPYDLARWLLPLKDIWGDTADLLPYDGGRLGALLEDPATAPADLQVAVGVLNASTLAAATQGQVAIAQHSGSGSYTVQWWDLAGGTWTSQTASSASTDRMLAQLLNSRSSGNPHSTYRGGSGLIMEPDMDQTPLTSQSGSDLRITIGPFTHLLIGVGSATTPGSGTLRARFSPWTWLGTLAKAASRGLIPQ